MSHIEDVIAGLTILAKYPAASVNAVHDQLFAGPDVAEVSPDDAERLTALGWHVEEDSWSKFT